jgi:signal transduction histidine kinase
MPGKAGVGIRGMRERLRQLGGKLEIEAQLDGIGTVVRAQLPVKEAENT